MTDALPEVPDLDSTKVAGASFGRSRKGFEPTEVRTLLGRIADALRVWEQRDAALATRVEELSRRLDEAEEFDEDRVTEILGTETARIVSAARSAASEMRSEAERESTELLERSRAEAEATAEGLVAEARTDRETAATARTEAEEAAAGIVSDATETAEKAVTEATAEAELIRSEAKSSSETLLEESRNEAESLTTDAQTRHDEMIEAASTVLAERTGEAEEAAAEVRKRADAVLAEAEARAASDLDNARKEAERLVADAGAEADEAIEAARLRGREMLAETRKVRQKMLRDLAEKNRLGRQKVDGAKAARAGVIDSIRTTLTTLESALTDLDDGDRDLLRLADAAAAAVPDDVDTVARELEAELDDSSDGQLAADDASAVIDVTDDASAPDTDESPGETDTSEIEPQPADHEADSQTVATAPESADDAFGSETEEAVSEGADREAEDVGDEAEERIGEPAAVEASPAASGQMASVHDLFEKLRSGEDTDDVDSDISGDEVDVSAGGPANEMGAGTVGDGIDLSEPLTAPAATATDVTSAASPPSAGGAVTAGAGGAAAAVATAAPEVAASGDQGLLDRRDELLAPAERLIARNLKRLVGDEQNEVLDRARRHKRGRVELDSLLDAAALDSFTAGLADPYVLAAAAGAQMWSEVSSAKPVEPSREDVTERLVEQVSDLLEMRRVRIREALEAHDRAGADSSELVDLLRSAYRELRATAVPELAADLAGGAFNAGTATAAGSDSSWRWVPDNGGLPCADAEDNSLEGPVTCGQAFPTGDAQPPAHPGCRCILVPAPI